MFFGEYMGALDIKTAELIEGDLPEKALSMAKEWTEKNKTKLLEF